MMKSVFRLGLAALLMVTMVSGQAAAVDVSDADASITAADGGVITSGTFADGDHCETRLKDTDGDGDPEVVIDCNG